MTHSTFQVGDTVKLKSGLDDTPAVIVLFLYDIPGGVRLSRRIGGFAYWNVADLYRCT